MNPHSIHLHQPSGVDLACERLLKDASLCWTTPVASGLLLVAASAMRTSFSKKHDHLQVSGVSMYVITTKQQNYQYVVLVHLPLQKLR